MTTVKKEKMARNSIKSNDNSSANHITADLHVMSTIYNVKTFQDLGEQQ